MENEEIIEKKPNKFKATELLGCLLLFVTALIWGFAFVAQSKGMESVGPYTFQSVRSFLAAVFLSPYLIINRKKILNVQDFEGNILENPKKRRQILITGLLSIGIIFFLASTTQQIGIVLTDSVGKAGFITALYIVLVPLAGIFMKKPPRWIVFLCVAAAAFGLYLLCIKKGEGFAINGGDILIIVCAVLFSVHIILVDTFSGRINGVLIAFTQFLTVGILCGIGMIFFEKPDLDAIKDAAMPILYAGVLSSGVGYTLQILGQRFVEPTKASLIMCLESVFSVLGGWLLLHQSLTLREGIGCVIMFIAILVSQIFGNKPRTAGSESKQ